MIILYLFTILYITQALSPPSKQMNICNIDSIIYSNGDHQCEPPECENADSEDEFEFIPTSKERSPQRDDAGHVDAGLFLGILKILLDDTQSDTGQNAKVRTDYEEFMALAMNNEEEMPEVTW